MKTDKFAKNIAKDNKAVFEKVLKMLDDARLTPTELCIYNNLTGLYDLDEFTNEQVDNIVFMVYRMWQHCDTGSVDEMMDPIFEDPEFFEEFVKTHSTEESWRLYDLAVMEMISLRKAAERLDTTLEKEL